MDFPDDNSSDATAHTGVIADKLQELIDHLRKDVGIVDDLRARALFETSAEVLGGLRTAFIHYDEGTEEAWRRLPPRVFSARSGHFTGSHSSVTAGLRVRALLRQPSPDLSVEDPANSSWTPVIVRSTVHVVGGER